MLVFKMIASFPHNSFIYKQHEGLVPEEEEVMLHDLVEVGCKVAFDEGYVDELVLYGRPGIPLPTLLL